MCTRTKDGNLMSFQDLRDTDKNIRTFFLYLQLRDYYIKEIQTPKTKKTEVLDVMILTYRWTRLKAISKSKRLYSSLYYTG